MSSSSDIAVRVAGLSKKFRVGETVHSRSIAETVNRFNPFRRRYALPEAAKPASGHASEDFWALKDVSFDLPRGEVLGIVGRNGAGKSTLLKILSRITAPTDGRIEIMGRVGALLEVGTGFHPELTGRENVYLNGAVLGMSHDEVRRSFDAIVDFSGVERFIDTPVKRYSSGMYMRLAFAVAAHLRTEVLIVDEVLAVGDATFQEKCLGKMDELAGGGRTVLFVSHNMNAVTRLCTRLLCLQNGQVMQYGNDVRATINQYLFGGAAAVSSLWVAPREGDDPVFRTSALAVVGEDGKPITGGLCRGDAAWVVVEGQVIREEERLEIGYYLYTEDGLRLYESLSSDTARVRWPKMQPGPVALRCRIPTELLNTGCYRVELCVGIFCDRWIAQPGVSAPHVAFEITSLAPESPIRQGRPESLLAPVYPWEAAPVGLCLPGSRGGC